jgi:hypothetical protein
MKKFLLGLLAIAAVLLPLSQSAQAHWCYYRRCYGYHRVYWNHSYWRHGYYWNAAYPGPVIVVAP